ncbi:DNA translocase FtsK 4TM domain-containing protein [Alphaproteobacteria bacterium]|nr:DNA translocase FtsK 4TM domain-containing protein [Alphaproteobacteria bacterium]
MFKNFKDNFEKFLISFVLFFIGLITLVSLITYNQKDNSFFNYDSYIQDSSNILGAFGSYLSSFLIDIFGIISFFIPVFFIFHSLGMLFGKLITWYNWTLLPFLLIFSTLLAEFISQNYIGNSLSAGLLGIGLYNYLSYFLEEFWSPLIILFVLLIFTIVSIYFSLNIKAKQITKITNFIYNCLILIVFSFAKFFNFGKKVKLDKIFTSPQKKPSLSSKTNPTSAGKKKKLSLDFNFPSIELLEKPKKTPGVEIENRRNTEVNKALLANVLRDFKINGEITEVKQGPIVTLFELTPAPGTQSSSVIRLSDDIARSMRANSARISTIPGKDALGIEIPNKNRETVYLRELLDDDLYKSANCKLPLALGKDIFGRPVIVDLAKMPHLLVAGTTGSGKSVGINAMLLSILYQLTPEECRLILIDPKMLELSTYKGIPHLLTEVVTDPKKAISALKWVVKEMENRYQMMAHLGVREIDDYNIKVKKILDEGKVIFKETQVGYDSETGKPVMEKKPLDLNIFSKIIVVVDELADLMITSGKEIESAIQRLSQMARASGIHLIVATQRPSVDVITGTIKSNFPTRISYKVVNKINSRTILEEQGAEQLLGQGDLLITMLGDQLLRVHGPYVKTEEVISVVNHLKEQGEPEYLDSVTSSDEESNSISLGFSESGDDLYDKAVSIVCREKKASTSFIQRHLQIGYNRAARIIEKMESEGIVSPANHVGRREVLVGKDN